MIQKQKYTEHKNKLEKYTAQVSFMAAKYPVALLLT